MILKTILSINYSGIQPAKLLSKRRVVTTATLSQPTPSTSTAAAPPVPEAASEDPYDIQGVDDNNDDVTIVKVVRPTVTAVANPSTSNATPATNVAPTAKRPPVQHAPVDQDPLASEDPASVFKCKCGKIYRSKTALMKHIRVLVVGPVFRCIRCSRQFAELSNLRTHMESIHVEKYTGFYCAMCGEKFVHWNLFDRHRKNQHNEAMEL